MERNESLLIVASYFWSDTLNAFVFGHGPTSPTLADVLMLTDLDISTADNTHLFDTKPGAKVETRAIGGWSGYIQKYRRTGPINAKEQTTFLNMWLDKFVFCGRSAGPTSVLFIGGRKTSRWRLISSWLILARLDLSPPPSSSQETFARPTHR